MRRPKTLDDMRRDVARWRQEADDIEKHWPDMVADLRSRADAVEKAIALYAGAAKIPVTGPIHRGIDIDTQMSTTRQGNPEATEKRISAIINTRRAADPRPFVRWIGDERIQTWAQRHQHALTHEALQADRVYSYIRRDPATRVPAPGWFRDMVYAESKGEVSRSSWDDDWYGLAKKPRKPRKN